MKPKKITAKKKVAASSPPAIEPIGSKIPAPPAASQSAVKKTSLIATKEEKLQQVTKTLKKTTPRETVSEETVVTQPVIPPTPVAKPVGLSKTLKTSLAPTAAKKISEQTSLPTEPVTPKPTRRKTVSRKLVAPDSPAPKTIEIKLLPSQAPARKAPANIPAILLEGDNPNVAPISGPGQRYAVGPTPTVEKLEAEGELPEAYGTQQLLLAARDPHWLYAHWDLTSEQQRLYNSFSMDRHLVLRIHENDISDQAVQEVHVHPESRHWFVHVHRAGIKYLAELGYYRAKGQWVKITTSSATFTPPDTISDDTSAEFATIPFELPMAKLLSLVKEAVHENVPLAEALQEIVTEDHPEWQELFGNTEAFPKTGWTAAQDQALAEILSLDSVRRVWMGSLEITELIRRRIAHELASMAAANLGGIPEGAPTSPAPALGEISSPPGAWQPSEKGFWFNVNAELIIYGATEPDAAVTIAGRKIQLRPDGSFSYRFALPDGQYELPVVAISADQTDGRAAELVFHRSTEIHGEVGAHPQDSELKRPEAASL